MSGQQIVRASSLGVEQAPEIESKEHQQASKGKALPDLFNRDVLYQTQQNEPKTPAFWNKLLYYLSFGWINPTQSSNPTAVKDSDSSKVEAAGSKKTGTIDRTPVLDPPQPIMKTPGKLSADAVKLKNMALKSTVDDLESLEKIIMQLIKDRIEMEERQGVVSTSTMEKFQELKRVSRTFLETLKEEVEKNQKNADRLAYAQSIAAYAAVIAAVATFPVWGLPASITAAAAGVTGVAAGLTTAGKAYTDHVKKNSEAKKEERSHTTEVIGDGITIQTASMADAVEQITNMTADLFDMQDKKMRIIDLVKQR